MEVSLHHLQEIERLKDENSKLLSRVHALEAKVGPSSVKTLKPSFSALQFSQATDALTAKEQLQEDLQIQQNSPIRAEDFDTSRLQQKISELQLQLNEVSIVVWGKF